MVSNFEALPRMLVSINGGHTVPKNPVKLCSPNPAIPAGLYLCTWKYNIIFPYSAHTSMLPRVEEISASIREKHELVISSADADNNPLQSTSEKVNRHPGIQAKRSLRDSDHALVP